MSPLPPQFRSHRASPALSRHMVPGQRAQGQAGPWMETGPQGGAPSCPAPARVPQETLFYDVHTTRSGRRCASVPLCVTEGSNREITFQ